MDFRKAMLSPVAIGIGCRKGATAQAIAGLVQEMLGDAPPFSGATLFSIARKSEEAGLRDAAKALGLDLVFLDDAEFLARQGEFSARGAAASTKSLETTGFASVAEAAALMGGGPTARLILRRRAAHGVTCALAAPADALAAPANEDRT
jgi:cobalt-precorrin 5A hydrolase